jgi:hypothetical protein
MAMRKKQEAKEVEVKAPNYVVFKTTLMGTAPYVSNNFAQESQEMMAAAQAAGDAGKKGKKRDPKDFAAAYRGSLHESEDGWYGIPATAFRSSLIRACVPIGLEMTKARMSIFVEADGYEKGTGTPLVKFTKGRPEMFKAFARNASGGADIRARGRFAPGWECVLRVRFDADFFTLEKVANLVARAGISVGVGAGRPFSKMSDGCGWGTFEIKDVKKIKAA